MSHIEALFPEYGSLSKLATELRCPVQTVHNWKRNGKIPRWRRRHVLDAASRLNLALPPETIVYLTQTA